MSFITKLINFLTARFTVWHGVCLLAVFLNVAILAPALIGAKVFGTDSLELVMPQLAFYKHAFEKQESPFWNPYLAVGFPSFVSGAGFPFAPLYLFLYILPVVSVHYWGLFITLALASVFFILFLRELGIGPVGAMIGSLGYLAGNIVFARDLVLGTSLFIQAALFWILIKIYKSDSTKAQIIFIFFGGGLVGYGWWIAAYFPILYIALVATSFVLFLGLRGGTRKNLFRMLSALFFIFLIGTTIGLLQLVPAYVIKSFSQRAYGFIDVAAQDGYALSIWDLLRFSHLTPDRGIEAYLYMGIIPLLFLFISFFSKNAFIIFFRWVFIVALALSIKGSPLFWFIVKLPLFSFFQGAARFMLVGIFAASVLVGFGSDYLLNVLRQNNLVWVKKWLTRFMAFMALTLLLSPIVYNSQGVTSSVLISGLFLVLAALIFYLFSKGIDGKKIVLILLLVSSIEFVVIFYRFNAGTTLDASAYVKPLTAQFFQKNPGRILPIFVDDWDDAYFYQVLKKPAPPAEEAAPYVFDLEFETYFPNFSLLNNIETLEINDPLLNVEMGRMLALLGTRQLVTTGGEEKLNKLHLVKEDAEKLTDISVAEKYKLLKERFPLINFLGVRYLLSAYGPKGSNIELPVSAFAELTIMGKDLPPMPMFIYQNPNARPLAYFSKITDFKENDELAYTSFKESGFDGIFVTCADCEKKSFTAEGEVHLDKKENGKVFLKTSSPAEQFLVFTQNYLPGWKALIDGEEVPIYKVNSVFIGVFVPAGNHEVELIYDYWSLFDWGLLFGKK